MIKTRALNFNLKIQGHKDRLTIFSLPKGNKYQVVTGLNYSKKDFTKIADKHLSNEALFLNGNIEANIKFKAILKSIDKPIQQELEGKFTYNDKFVNSNDLKIRQIAKGLKGKSQKETIINTYQYVLNYLDYGYPYDGLYSYTQSLRDRVTDCGGFSTLLMSLLSANKINSRLVVGFVLKNNRATKLLINFPIAPLTFDNIYMHVWVEAEFSKNLWLTLDPSLEKRRQKGLTKRLGGFEKLPNDRLVLSFGHNLEFSIKNKKINLPILQNPVSIKI